MRMLWNQHDDSNWYRDTAVPSYGAARRCVAFSLVLVALLAGCGKPEQLKTEYGRRRGSADASVNGVSVLAEMFRNEGGHPATIIGLSSNLDKYDVVVWAPDDFALPSEDVREFLEKWLTRASERTLVYLGRDYDASCDYWEAMVSNAPADQRMDVMRRVAESRAAHSRARIDMPEDECCEWFVMRRDLPGRHVDALSGPWSVGVDATRSQVWSQGRLDIPTRKELSNLRKGSPPAASWEPDYRPLLTSGKDTLVFEVSKPAWEGSRILVVANGSFLLNLPLVNHQHRHMAGQLIDECKPFNKVAFLESQAGGPFVLGDFRSVDEDSLRMRILLAAHWFLLGAVYCLYVFPIFGRPKTMETETVADFGQHVDAMASLLERTRDTDYARSQLEAYRKGQRAEMSNSSEANGAATFAIDSTVKDEST